MKYTHDSLLQRSGDIITSEADGEIVMMNIETGQYHSINEVGSDIWKMLESPIKLSDICKNLLADYDIDEKTCEDEVLKFVEHLSNEGLLLS